MHCLLDGQGGRGSRGTEGKQKGHGAYRYNGIFNPCY